MAVEKLQSPDLLTAQETVRNPEMITIFTFFFFKVVAI